MSTLSISAALSRASLNARNAKHGKQIPDVRPCAIHAVKLKIGQTAIATRRMRSQLGRLNDRIIARTNAIIRTREQQSEVPAVAGAHNNTIAQLRRSIGVAANALAALRSDVTKTVNDDRTFIIKELEEEVKLLYSENLRLNERVRGADRQLQCYERLLQEAAHKASGRNRSILRQQIKDLMGEDAALRAKAVAYRSKKKRLDIEAAIIEHIQRKMPPQKTVGEATQRRQELEEKIASESVELAAGKRAFLRKMEELKAIIEAQKDAIVKHLTPPSGDSDEDDLSGGEEEDNKEM
jgi:hypothetical protein